MKKPLPRSSVLESLEPRLAPAGVVTVGYNAVTNVLTFTGDAADNEFTLTVDANGYFDITGQNGTLLESDFGPSAGLANIPVMATVKFALGDGNDKVTITADANAPVLTFDKAFEFLGGKGNDTLQLGTDGAQGIVFHGTTKFDMGEGSDTFIVGGSTYFENKVTYLSGSGGGLFKLDGTTSATHQFAKGLTVDLGTNVAAFAGLSEFVSAGKLNIINGKLEIKGSGGAMATSNVTLESAGDAYIDDGLTITLANGGASTVKLIGGKINVGGAVAITTGLGGDAVEITGIVYAATSFNVDLKDGANTFKINASSGIAATSVLLKGGKAGLDITFEDSGRIVTQGAFVIDVKANTLSLNLFELKSNASFDVGSFSYFGGTQQDAVGTSGTGTKINVRGNYNLSLGAGDNFVSYTDCEFGVFGGLIVSSLAGNDTLEFRDSELFVLGAMSVNLGNGTNAVTQERGVLQMYTTLNITGGTGADHIEFKGAAASTTVGRGTIVTLGDGSNEFLLNSPVVSIGALTYTGGKNADSVILRPDFALGAIIDLRGNLTVKLGAGTNSLALVQTGVYGSVNVQSLSLATETDLLQITGSGITSLLTANLGAGISTFRVDDSSFTGVVTVNTGAGNDLVELDHDADLSGANRWNNSVRILTGVGSDYFSLGSGVNLDDPDCRNIFKSPSFVVMDAGTGVGIDTSDERGSRNLVGATIFIDIQNLG